MERKIVKDKIPDSEYKKILENIPICTVDLVILNRGRVLLVYRRGGSFRDQWFLPGGRVYKNEKLVGAAKRKALEETGLDVRIKKNLGAYEWFDKDTTFKDIKNGTHTISTVFVVETSDDDVQIKLDKTSTAHKWVDKIESNLHPYVKNILKDSQVFS